MLYCKGRTTAQEVTTPVIVGRTGCTTAPEIPSSKWAGWHRRIRGVSFVLRNAVPEAVSPTSSRRMATQLQSLQSTSYNSFSVIVNGNCYQACPGPLAEDAHRRTLAATPHSILTSTTMSVVALLLFQITTITIITITPTSSRLKAQHE